MQHVFHFLLPWEFSPAAFALCIGAVALYARGLAKTPSAERPAAARSIAYFTGWVLVYAVMQTHFDYLSQHMFFIHRLQHLVLHHMGPFLVALSAPVAVLSRTLPDLGFVWRSRPVQLLYRSLQNAVVAPLLFVGLIGFWLTPSIHFDAMLSARYYAIMNWSMLLDGLLFWALVLDPRSKQEGALLGFGTRIFMVLLAILPQIGIGSYIALSPKDLFDVYAVCGRAWDLPPRADQMLGGLITWIPAGMMHVIATLILIGRWMRADGAPAPARPTCAPS